MLVGGALKTFLLFDSSIGIWAQGSVFWLFVQCWSSLVQKPDHCALNADAVQQSKQFWGVSDRSKAKHFITKLVSTI